LTGGLCCTRLDFSFGQGAERVVDNHRGQIAHAQRVALYLRFVQKLGGDNDRGRPA